MEQLPQTIYKHWIGYVAIFVAALFVILFFSWGALEMIRGGLLDPVSAFWYTAFLIGVVTGIAAIQIWVYSISRITLTVDGVEFRNWITLFYSKNEEFEWVRVSRVTAKKSNIFAQLLDFGTIEIETEGGHIAAIFTMVPDDDRVQDIMQALADQATIDGSN